MISYLPHSVPYTSIKLPLCTYIDRRGSITKLLRTPEIIDPVYSRLGAVAAAVAQMIDGRRRVQVRLVARGRERHRVRQLEFTLQVVPLLRLAAYVELARPTVHVSPLQRVAGRAEVSLRHGVHLHPTTVY